MLLHDIPRERGYTIPVDIQNAYRAFRDYFGLPLQIRVINYQIVDAGFLDVEGMETGVPNTWKWWGTPTAQWGRNFQERTERGYEFPPFDRSWIERVVYEPA